MSFRNEGEKRRRKTDKICPRRPTLKEWLKEFCKQKGNKIRKNLNISGRKNIIRKNMSKTIAFEFSKLYLMIKAKILKLF